ncbi:hypothetical protein [Cetobacterium sp.]|uniref:hypothetical protein n=1 Tax=Cetobacterium sp. TaxID=2071632 RepID=UPI003F2E0E47
MSLIMIIIYSILIVFYYLFVLNNNLEDRRIFINYSEKKIVVIKTLYGWYFVSENKNIFLKSKTLALFYLLSRGYIPK